MSKIVPVSLISTIARWEENIRVWLDSIIKMSYLPQEFIVIDGGGVPETKKMFKKYQRIFSKKGVDLIYKVKKNSNISQGRNTAFSLAKNKWVASIDGGTIASKDWLEGLYETQKQTRCDIVSGTYKPLVTNYFEKIQGYVVTRDLEKLPKDKAPSSRSYMIKKSFWKKVGGYSEKIYTAEDTFYNHKLRKIGAKYMISKQGYVLWRMRPNLKKFTKQFFLYGVGDGRIRLWFKFFSQRNNRDARSSFIVLLSFYGSIVIGSLGIFHNSFYVFFLLPVFFSLMQAIKKGIEKKDLFSIPLCFFLFFIRRLAYFFGFNKGFFQSFLTNYEQ